MIEENKKNYVSYWLFSIILLICLMIVVGGLTRLTDSGLSIDNLSIHPCLGIFFKFNAVLKKSSSTTISNNIFY